MSTPPSSRNWVAFGRPPPGAAAPAVNRSINLDSGDRGDFLTVSETGEPPAFECANVHQEPELSLDGESNVRIVAAREYVSREEHTTPSHRPTAEE